MRSLLLVPADDDARLSEACETEADGVCLDVDRSVDFEASTRKNACAWIAASKARARQPLIFVRVNPLDTDQLEADLDAVLPAAPDGLVLPQCRGGRDLQHLGAMLAVKEAECGFADGATSIIADVAATAASIFSMGTFAGASRRLKALAWNSESFAAALGSQTSRDLKGCLTTPFALARSLTLVAARAAGVLAIDEISPNSGDYDTFRQECEAARRDGFDAKFAIDRTQVQIINAVFARDA